jgi:imidazolonepropionase-like amidohydrolase
MRPAIVMFAVFCSSCATPTSAVMTSVAPKALPPSIQPSAAQPGSLERSASPVLLKNVVVLTAAGKRFDKGHLLFDKGLIVSVGGGDGTAPAGALVIDGQGQFVTPGIIDTHSHNGVYPSPGTDGNSDGNEATAPTTAQVRSQDGFWPQDPNLWRALSGGVTTLQILPGSANLIGGRSFVAHLNPGPSALAMRFPGAPEGVKMACGENPKRVYGSRNQMPSTRMGNAAVMRAVFQKATEYRRQLKKYERDLSAWKEKQTKKKSDGQAPAKPGEKPDEKPDDPPEPPPRDYASETLVDVMDGKILVHNHCYRADEMHFMLDLAKEFGFKIRSFHHAVEAYKLAPRLAQENVAVSTWVDWWGFKMEAFDGVPQNVAMVAQAGGRPILHSEVRRLNQEAAKARTAGAQFGLQFSDDQVLRWVTANPAWALGIDDKVGTLEVGKMADVVLWNRDPLSVYALAQMVFVNGALVYDRAHHQVPLSDFELGILDAKELP